MTGRLVQFPERRQAEPGHYHMRLFKTLPYISGYSDAPPTAPAAKAPETPKKSYGLVVGVAVGIAVSLLTAVVISRLRPPPIQEAAHVHAQQQIEYTPAAPVAPAVAVPEPSASAAPLSPKPANRRPASRPPRRHRAAPASDANHAREF